MPINYDQWLTRAKLTPEQALARSNAIIARKKQRYRDGRSISGSSSIEMLTPQARAHVSQGGCGGDLCGNCNGRGEENTGWQAAGLNDICHVCNGRGMR